MALSMVSNFGRISHAILGQISFVLERDRPAIGLMFQSMHLRLSFIPSIGTDHDADASHSMKKRGTASCHII